MKFQFLGYNISISKLNSNRKPKLSVLVSKTKVSGELRVRDWKERANELEQNFNDYQLWESTFSEFFENRIKTRFLNPITSLENSGAQEGEGYAIMTLACSLIEFLETTYQGKIFSQLTKDELIELELNACNYYGFGKSNNFIGNFLKRAPRFSEEFRTRKQRDEFYGMVRCGLMHEANLAGDWVINITDKTKGRIVVYEEEQTLLNRIEFVKAIREYLGEYKQELLQSDDLKRKFIIKYNGLCEYHLMD